MKLKYEFNDGTALTVSIVLMCNPATAAFGAGMFEAGTTAALSGTAMEGMIGGIARYINGGSFIFKLKNDEKEEIVCTEDHPFYVKDIGWINAINLVANDKILLYNNDIAILYNIEIEELETQEITYNFEVEDFHTYYVGKNQLLVHNCCNSVSQYNNYSDDFLEWLNKGDKNNTVYNCFDSLENNVYIGITKQNLNTRFIQHIMSGKKSSTIKARITNLTRNQARAIETKLILDNRGVNKILSISKNNKFFDEAIFWATKFLGR